MFATRLKLFLCGLASVFVTTALAQSPIKIGYVTTLSGQAGTLGQDMYDGFMMVVERNGGKLGGVPVQILKEDDHHKTRHPQRHRERYGSFPTN